MTTEAHTGIFYGWHVVGAASVLAVFGWGIGFYGPPVFLSVVRGTSGWPVALISAAVTLHFSSVRLRAVTCPRSIGAMA